MNNNNPIKLENIFSPRDFAKPFEFKADKIAEPIETVNTIPTLPEGSPTPKKSNTGTYIIVGVIAGLLIAGTILYIKNEKMKHK